MVTHQESEPLSVSALNLRKFEFSENDVPLNFRMVSLLWLLEIESIIANYLQCYLYNKLLHISKLKTT